MKKIYLFIFSFLFLGAIQSQSVKAPTGEMGPDAQVVSEMDHNDALPTKTHPLERRGLELDLGTSYNVYTILLDGQNQLYYNEDLNALSFVHRQNNGAPGGSGIISYDYSLDGGATWNTDNKPITPSADGTGYYNGNRYPSGSIMNEAGNTDPANAYFVAAGPALQTHPDFGRRWGLEFAASSPLVYDGSNVSDNYYANFDTSSFHPYALTCNPDGSCWYVSTQVVLNTAGNIVSDAPNSYNKFYVCKLTMDNGQLKREIKAELSPNWSGIEQLRVNGDWNMSFSPDGQIGYVVHISTDVDNEPYGGTSVKPIVWKSTDGGENWTKHTTLDYNQFPMLLDYTVVARNGEPMPLMNDMDLTVDKNGTLHIMANMAGRSTPAIDSMGWRWTGDSAQTIGHFMTDGIDWEYNLVDVWGNTNGAFDGIGMGARVQASRTPDGSVVFATYLQTWENGLQGQVFADANNNPDVFGYAYMVDSKAKAGPKWLSNIDEEFFFSGFYYFGTASPVSIVNGDDHMYEIPVAATVVGGTALEPVNHFYAKGFGFDMSDFIVSTDKLDKAHFDVKVYPNPSYGAVTIDLSRVEQTLDAYLIDQTGRTVKHWNALQNVDQIYLNDLPSGLYHLRLQNEDQFDVRKILHYRR